MVLIAGFFGVFTLFIKTHWMVRIIAIGSFIDCFFSAAPYISFTSYCSIVLCCYFYISCCNIEDWPLVFKAVQSLLLLNAILLSLEFFHKDNLMDWGAAYNFNFGVLGHHMQMGSFAVVISALLISFSTLNFLFPVIVAVFCQSSWAFFSAGAGAVVYMYSKNKNVAAMVFIGFMFIFCLWDLSNNKFKENLSPAAGRITVWQKTFELANKHPFVGWGPGTYKLIFAPLSRMKSIPYKTAHNFIAQLVFEVGYPATGCLLFGLGWLCGALWRAELYTLTSGLAMIVIDALVHFPDRCMQMVPLIIVFLAYCTFCLKKDKLCLTHSLLS